MNRVMKVFLCWILLIAVSVSAGCGKEKEEQEYDYCLYFLDSTETKVASEGYTMRAADIEGQIAEMLEAINSAEPENFSYKKAKPDNVIIRECGYDIESRSITLNFDSGYTSMNSVTEILCRAAIVKMLCQIDGVDSVSFQVGGFPLMNSSGNPTGRMTAEDFIDNTGGQNANVTVYFANEDGTKLLGSDVTVAYDGTLSMEQIILGQLVNGPIEEGLYQTIPEGTKVLGITTKDGICYVDLSEEFMKKRSGVSAEVTVYSVVNSLVELSNVNKVQFTIEGEARKTYDDLDFSGVFERNLELIDSEN